MLASSLMILLALTVGFGLGYGIVYLLNKPLTQSIPQLNQDISNLQTALATKDSHLVASNSERQSKQLELVALTAEYTTFKEQTTERIAWINSSKDDLITQFKTISAQVLADNQQTFKQQSQTVINDSLLPLKNEIENFSKAAQSSYISDTKERSELKQMLKHYQESFQQSCLSLNKEAANLTHALQGSNKTQGNWGEMILEKALENVGLTQGREYEIQKTYKNEAGESLRPDVVVHLPGNKDIIIDSKVSLIAYSRSCETDDQKAREALLAEHVQSIKTHIKDLNSKNYTDLYGVNSIDMILLFIPVEAAYIAAIKHDSYLFEQAFDKKIVLVHPINLWSTLKIVEFLWRNEKQQRHAQDIAEQAGNMYDKFYRFLTEMDRIKDGLDKAQQAYETSYNHLKLGKGNLIARADRLKSLGIKVKQEIRESLVTQAVDDDSGKDNLDVKKLTIKETC